MQKNMQYGIAMGSVGAILLVFGTAAALHPFFPTDWAIGALSATELTLMLGFGLHFAGVVMWQDNPDLMLGKVLFAALGIGAVTYALPMLVGHYPIQLRAMAGFGLGIATHVLSLVTRWLNQDYSWQDFSLADSILTSTALGLSVGLSSNLAPMFAELVSTNYVASCCISIAAGTLVMHVLTESCNALCALPN